MQSIYYKRVISSLALMLLMVQTSGVFAKTLVFSDLVWEIKTGYSSPGPNYWSEDNVKVDEKGWLHLKITKVKDKWYCPGIISQKHLGFGQYWFYITGRVDTLDPNIVLALFNYTLPNMGPDGTNEIDIELTRWGAKLPESPNVSLTVWPVEKDTGKTQLLTKIHQEKEDITFGFTWTPKEVLFQGGEEHHVDYPFPLVRWLYAPPDFEKRIPSHAMPLYIDLNLTHGAAPTNNLEMEIVIKKFCFRALDGEINNCGL